jgi:RNA polymerase sigma factor (sigma-70 family)
MLEAEIKSFASLSDNEVIARVLAGEKSMYELIMRRHNPALFKIAISILENETDAEDVIQESYTKAYQHLQDFQQRCSFRTWVTKILINEALLKRKRERRFRIVDFFRWHDLPFRLKTAFFIKNANPEEQALNDELKNVLEKAILNLPKNYSEVYVMRELEQMNVKETSEYLGISETSAKVRLCRAKMKLKKFIVNAFETEIFPFHLMRCNRIVQNVIRKI